MTTTMTIFKAVPLQRDQERECNSWCDQISCTFVARILCAVFYLLVDLGINAFLFVHESVELSTNQHRAFMRLDNTGGEITKHKHSKLKQNRKTSGNNKTGPSMRKVTGTNWTGENKTSVTFL